MVPHLLQANLGKVCKTNCCKKEALACLRNTAPPGTGCFYETTVACDRTMEEGAETSSPSSYVPRKEISHLYRFPHENDQNTELQTIKRKKMKHKKRAKKKESSSEEEEATFLHEETEKDRNYHTTDDDLEKAESSMKLSTSEPGAHEAHSLIPHEELSPVYLSLLKFNTPEFFP